VLNKDEEIRLGAFLNASDRELKEDVTYTPNFYMVGIRFLATKLKETNDEAVRLADELQNANELSASLSERFE
jgi:hypothetical protein